MPPSPTPTHPVASLRVGVGAATSCERSGGRSREPAAGRRRSRRETWEGPPRARARRSAAIGDGPNQFGFGHVPGSALPTVIDRMSRFEYREAREGIKEIPGAYRSETAGAGATKAVGAARRPRRPSPVRCAGALALLLAATTPARALEMTGDHRLIRRFVEDAGLVQKVWLGVTGEYVAPTGGREMLATMLAAFRVGRDVEVGARAGFISRRRNAGETIFGSPLASSIDGAGIADMMIFGKYRVLRGPFEMALGASATLPLADDERGLGPGNVQGRGFAAFRKNLRPATLVFNLGATDRSASRGQSEARGRVAAALGAGILVPLSYDWTFLSELTYDGVRYDGGRSDGRFLAGLDWRPTPNIVFRGSLARGLPGGAPPYAATLTAAFRF